MFLMVKILNQISIDVFAHNLKKVIFRFPLTVFILMWGVISLLFLHNWDFSNSINDQLWKGFMSLILVFFFTLWMYLNSEWRRDKKIITYVLQITPLCFGVLFYSGLSYDISSFENFVFFFLSIAWIIAYLFFAPYFTNILPKSWDIKFVQGEWLLQVKQKIFYSYFYSIAVIFLVSSILGWILFVLGSIGISTIDTLFSVSFINGDTYWNWAIIALAWITPLFALTQIPEYEDFYKDTFIENTFFSFLIKFVLVPFITMYFIILYLYTCKVLINFSDWPKWEVSWMVIWFSVLWYLSYIFSYTFEKKTSIIKKFRTIFPLIVVPQVWMLFYAIYLRITQYDITVNRYFVVVFWLWLLVVSIYYIFSKKKKLIIIPVVLTLFTIIISVWPWSVYRLPQSRQLDRLEENLAEAGIMKIKDEMYWYNISHEIVPLTSYNDIDQGLSKNIYGWIQYLCDFDNCSSIKELFPEIYAEIFNEEKAKWEKNTWTSTYTSTEEYKKGIEDQKREVYPWINNTWIIVKKITERIKVRNYLWQTNNNHGRLSFSSIRWYNEEYPINVKGYDILTKIEPDSYKFNDGLQTYVVFDVKNKILKFIESDKILEEIWVEKIIKEIYELQIGESFNGRYDLEKGQLDFVIEWKIYSYKLLLDSIDLPNPLYKNDVASNNRDFFLDVSWSVLIRKK